MSVRLSGCHRSVCPPFSMHVREIHQLFKRLGKKFLYSLQQKLISWTCAFFRCNYVQKLISRTCIFFHCLCMYLCKRNSLTVLINFSYFFSNLKFLFTFCIFLLFLHLCNRNRLAGPVLFSNINCFYIFVFSYCFYIYEIGPCPK